MRSLFPDWSFVNCGAKPFTRMQLWEQVSAPEQPGMPVLCGLPRIPQLSLTLQISIKAGFVYKSFYGSGYRGGMLCLWYSVNAQVDMEMLKE